jgi:hypothetical protein
MTVIDSTVALAMFSGTIHFVVTLEGGPLVEINWVSVESHYPAVRCFEYEIRAKIEEDLRDVFQIYATQLNASLTGSDTDRHQEVLTSWVEIIYPKLATGPSKKVWESISGVRNALNNFFNRGELDNLNCCECSGRQIPALFKKCHMADLEPRKSNNRGR